MKSIVKELGLVSFPEFLGERIYMVPFTKTSGLPVRFLAGSRPLTKCSSAWSPVRETYPWWIRAKSALARPTGVRARISTATGSRRWAVMVAQEATASIGPDAGTMTAAIGEQVPRHPARSSDPCLIRVRVRRVCGRVRGPNTRRRRLLGNRPFPGCIGCSLRPGAPTPGTSRSFTNPCHSRSLCKEHSSGRTYRDGSPNDRQAEAGGAEDVGSQSTSRLL